jgi:SnoaL-like domain
MSIRYILSLFVAASLSGCAISVDTNAPLSQTRAKATAQINAILDAWHIAASEGDLDGYFGLMDDDAVFLGTDDWERWPRDEFYAFAAPFFGDGEGWTFVPRDRVIAFSDDRRVAWFDEKLDSEHMGLLRGSGVLEHSEEGWKIKQYNLAFTIPNDLVDDVKARIDEYNASKADNNSP